MIGPIGTPADDHENGSEDELCVEDATDAYAERLEETFDMEALKMFEAACVRVSLCQQIERYVMQRRSNKSPTAQVGARRVFARDAAAIPRARAARPARLATLGGDVLLPARQPLRVHLGQGRALRHRAPRGQGRASLCSVALVEKCVGGGRCLSVNLVFERETTMPVTPFARVCACACEERSKKKFAGTFVRPFFGRSSRAAPGASGAHNLLGMIKFKMDDDVGAEKTFKLALDAASYTRLPRRHRLFTYHHARGLSILSSRCRRMGVYTARTHARERVPACVRA